MTTREIQILNILLNSGSVTAVNLNTAIRCPIGGLYTTLNRMVNKGLIKTTSYQVYDPFTNTTGRTVRLYHLTRAGEKTLAGVKELLK